jgi:hypothetical protein
MRKRRFVPLVDFLPSRLAPSSFLPPPDPGPDPSSGGDPSTDPSLHLTTNPTATQPPETCLGD